MNSKIAVAYFLRLVANEFARDVGSQTLRQVINDLCSHPRFETMSCQYAYLKSELVQLVRNINSDVFANRDYRDAAQQGVMIEYVVSRVGCNMDHPYKTSNG
jgi:hypothetical protein